MAKTTDRMTVNGTTYLLMDAAAHEEISAVDEAVHEEISAAQDTIDATRGTVADKAGDAGIFDKSGPNATTTGWRMTSDGLCTSNAGYALKKWAVTAGEVYEIDADDYFQFQNGSTVPSSGTSPRIGPTYTSGKYTLICPDGATYLVASTPTTGSTLAVKIYHGALSARLDEKIDYLAKGKAEPELKYLQGMIDGANGAFSPASTQIRTGFVYVGAGNFIWLEITGSYQVNVRWYSKADTETYVSGENNVSGWVQAPADYLAFSVNKTNWGDITPGAGSNVAMRIYGNHGQSEAMLLSISQSYDKTAYVNVDTFEKTVTFGNSPTGTGRTYLRVGQQSFQVGGRSIDYSAEYTIANPFVFFYYHTPTDTFVCKDAGAGTARTMDSSYIYIGCVWGLQQTVLLNAYPFYYVNGVKTLPGDGRNAFDIARQFGRNSYNIGVLGDSTSTYDGISEDEIGGREVHGAYYPAGDITDSSQMWWAILRKALRFGGGVNVSAISRSRYLDDIDADGIYAPAVWNEERISRVSTNPAPHYIFVSAGINDGFISSGSIGAFGYHNKETDILEETQTVARGIELTIRRLQDSNPYARIVLMIPKLVGYNTSSYNWEAYYKMCDLVEQIGKAYGVYKIVDLRKCGITQELANNYTIDGIHPNAAGMELIAKYVYNCITDQDQPVYYGGTN